jgi:cytochrome c553
MAPVNRRGHPFVGPACAASGVKGVTSMRLSSLPLAACVVAPILWLTASCDASAGDVKAGRASAVACQACHGIDGISKAPDAPNIAGQTEPYLITQLRAFKSGARKNESMSVVAATLSDRQIEDLAAYYSAIEITVGRIPGE